MRIFQALALKEGTVYVSNTGKNIEEKVHVRDLGVIMSNTANFKYHINHVTKSSSRLASWILRTFESRNVDVMLTLWKSIVLPIFDYCSQLYNPYRVGEIQQLEMVQRSFVRKINGMHGLTYWEQLQKLKLFSLERRRERYRIIYIWKIVEEIVPDFSEQNGGIEVLHRDRRGRACFQPALHRSPYRELRNANLAVQGVSQAVQ